MNRAIRKSRLIFNACRIILKTWRWSGMTAIKTTKGFSGLMSGTARVIYHSKNDASSKTFDALYWLAQLTIHIPNRGEQMCRYYGYYSNKSRGMRNKSGADDAVPALMEPVLTSRVMQKSWARPDSEDLSCGSPIMPEMQGHHEDHRLYRRAGHHSENSGAYRHLGYPEP